MKQILIINGQPFEYEAVDLTAVGAPAISFEQAKSILFKTKQLLDKHAIKFWLHYGTLLGAVREHSFISHDYDVDIMTDQLDDLVSAIPSLYKEGLRLIRVQEGLLYSFTYAGVYIDIYIMSKAPFPLSLWCYKLNGHFVPKKLMSGLQQIEFLGDTFNIPANPEKLLQFYYGNTWRIPIKGKEGTYTIWLHRMYRKFIIKPNKRRRQ